MKKYIAYISCLWLLTTSCNDWLNVRPQTQVAVDEMFTTYAGFQGALTGCYIKMKDRALYGENLTMSHIESMAQLWLLDAQSTRTADVDFQKYEFNNTAAKKAIESVYSGLYNVICQANLVIQNIETNGNNIDEPAGFAIIKGEAYALRAFCHLDILRLFGQMPKEAVKKISLPYAETVSIKDLPAYYDYTAFIAKLEKDLLVAEEAMEKLDPILEQGMDSGENDDVMQNYRRLDLNYYAVKALQARFYLYTGQNEKAYEAAKVVYDAMPVELSGLTDPGKGYNACPSECLFALSNNELINYSGNVLGCGSELITADHLYISEERLEALYKISSDNRYSKAWNREHKNVSSKILPVVTKYYYSTDKEYSAEEYLTKLQLIPLIRMSEVYLILLETTNDLTEANQLYRDYMASHNIMAADGFASIEEARKEVINEIRREFCAEGQLFFAYKRLGTTRMLWGTRDMGEEQYIWPLPDTEYDPAGPNR